MRGDGTENAMAKKNRSPSVMVGIVFVAFALLLIVFALIANIGTRGSVKATMELIFGYTDRGYEVALLQVDTYIHEGVEYNVVKWRECNLQTKKTDEFHTVFVCRGASVNAIVSLLWDDMGEFQTEYDRYREAVESGEHITYTQKELREFEEKFTLR